MTTEVMISKGFTGCISYCHEDKKIRATLAFECSMQRIKDYLQCFLLMLALFIFKNFQFFLILFKLRSKKSSFVFKKLQNPSILFKILHFSTRIYISLQNSTRMFNLITTALKKSENSRVIGEKFNTIQSRVLKYPAAQMLPLTNDL